MNLKNEVNTSVCDEDNSLSLSGISEMCSFTKYEEKTDSLKTFSCTVAKSDPNASIELQFTPIVTPKMFQLIKNQFSIIFKVTYPEEFFKKVFEKKYYSIVGVSKSSGDIICFSHIDVLKVNKTATILTIGVFSEFQNKKVGGRLLNKVIEEMRILGISSISLIVQASNDIAIKLYKRFGFETTRIIEDYYCFEDLKENVALEMTLRLSVLNKKNVVNETIGKLQTTFEKTSKFIHF